MKKYIIMSLILALGVGALFAAGNAYKTRVYHCTGTLATRVTMDQSYEPPIKVDSFYVFSTNTTAACTFTWQVLKPVTRTNGTHFVSTNTIVSDSFTNTYILGNAGLVFDWGDVLIFSNNTMLNTTFVLNFTK